MNKMDSENETPNKSESPISIIGVSGSIGGAEWPPSNLRYVKKLVMLNSKIARYELRLQQMWQSQDGTQRWKWIEEVYENDIL